MEHETDSARVSLEPVGRTLRKRSSRWAVQTGLGRPTQRHTEELALPRGDRLITPKMNPDEVQAYLTSLTVGRPAGDRFRFRLEAESNRTFRAAEPARDTLTLFRFVQYGLES